MKCAKDEIKTCKCGSTDFYWKICRRKKSGEPVRVRMAICKFCFNKQASQRLLNNRPKYLFRTFRGVDRRANKHFDLTEAFIRSILKGPCCYCLDETLPLTLDRKDNRLGHTKNNTNVCCIRCNSIRGSMPLIAWLILVPSLRIAQKNGLFGDWHGASSSRLAYPRH